MRYHDEHEETWEKMCERLKRSEPLRADDHIDFEMVLHDQDVIEREVMTAIGARKPSTIILTLSTIVGLIAGAAAEGDDKALWDQLQWARTIMDQASISVHKQLREDRMSDPFKHGMTNPARRKR